jgi:hypothetical protein
MDYRGRSVGVLGALKVPEGCELATYHRAYRQGLEPQGRNVLAKRAHALCESGCSIRQPGDLAALAAKLLGAEISRREHVFLVLVDDQSVVRLIGSFSSKHVSLCAFDFGKMVPDLNATLFDVPDPGGLYMIHNHPSGNAAFSEEDVLTTQRLIRMHEGMPFGIVDSVVVTKGGAFVSLRAEHDRLGEERYQSALRSLRFRGP